MKYLKKYDDYMCENFFSNIGKRIRKMFLNPIEDQKFVKPDVEKDWREQEQRIIRDRQEQKKIREYLVSIVQDIKEDMSNDLRTDKIKWKVGFGGANEIFYHFKNGDIIYFTYVSRGSTLVYKKSGKSTTVKMNMFFTKDFIDLFKDITK